MDFCFPELLKKEDDREIKANGALEEEKSQVDFQFFIVFPTGMTLRRNI